MSNFFEQALVPGAAYTRALLGLSDRRLQDRYCAWVAAAHKRFDEVWTFEWLHISALSTRAAVLLTCSTCLLTSTKLPF